MNKTTSCRHELQKVSVETSVTKSAPSGWRGRYGAAGSGRTKRVPLSWYDRETNVKKGPRDTLAALWSHSHFTTDTIQAGYARIAEIAGCCETTAKKHIALLKTEGHLIGWRQYDFARKCYGETVYKVVLFPDKKHPTPQAENDPPFNSFNPVVESLKDKDTPLPPKGGGDVQFLNQNEPQRPKPDPETHEALRAARELRAQRRAERRASRPQRRSYREARKSVRAAQEGPLTVRGAVAYIMRSCGFSPALHATRLAVQTSVEKWVRDDWHGGIDAAAVRITKFWKDYQYRSRLLDYPCGALTWFGECRWAEDWPKHEQRSLEAAVEASVGCVPYCTDLAHAKKRLAALREQFADIFAEVDADEAEADDETIETRGDATLSGSFGGYAARQSGGVEAE